LLRLRGCGWSGSRGWIGRRRRRNGRGRLRWRGRGIGLHRLPLRADRLRRHRGGRRGHSRGSRNRSRFPHLRHGRLSLGAVPHLHYHRASQRTGNYQKAYLQRLHRILSYFTGRPAGPFGFHPASSRVLLSRPGTHLRVDIRPERADTGDGRLVIGRAMLEELPGVVTCSNAGHDSRRVDSGGCGTSRANRGGARGQRRDRLRSSRSAGPHLSG